MTTSEEYLDYLGKQLQGTAPRTAKDHENLAHWMKASPNVERAITDLCEIREAAASMGDRGHDIAMWAQDALTALGYEG